MGPDRFQVSGSRIYDRLFGESEEGPFEVFPGRTRVGVIRKPVPGAPKLYFFSKARVLVCSIHFHICFYLLIKHLHHIVSNIYINQIIIEVIAQDVQENFSKSCPSC